MEKPFDCDCILEEIDLTPVLMLGHGYRLFLLNTDPPSTLMARYPIDACPVCKPKEKESNAIVLQLFVDVCHNVCLVLEPGFGGALVLRPDGAHSANEDHVLEPCDLVAALYEHAQHLEPMGEDALPQTDQPVLYKDTSGVPCLYFNSDSYALWSDGLATWVRGNEPARTPGLKVNLVKILHDGVGCTAEQPKKHESNAVVLELHQDTYGEVCLRLHTENSKAVWVLRQPYGARWLNDDGALEPCDLAADLREHARHLEATAAGDLPQTDQPVLFVDESGVPCLRFRVDTFALWGDGLTTWVGDDGPEKRGIKVNLSNLLHSNAIADALDEKPLDTPAAQALRSRVAGHLTLATVFRPIYVVWNDAVQHGGWHNLRNGDSFPLKTMEIMGHLVGETPAAIVVAQSVTTYEAGDLRIIPRAAIVKQGFTDGTPGHRTTHSWWT